MTSINWGMIQDGGCFESLIHAIIFANDPGAILFKRPGKDAGQDARSSDGTIVYQAKHSRDKFTMNDAVKIAIKELESIKRYKETTHANSSHWTKVLRWILVSNVEINPNDHLKWAEEVTPEFQKFGLVSEYWSIEYLNNELYKHPQIAEVFFGGENRVLIGLKEARDLLESEMVGPDSLEVPLVGRTSEIEQIIDFASDDRKRIVPVVGPGGIGKSRLAFEALLELVDLGWRVYWGLPGSMAISSSWFRILNGNQCTIVVLDNPDSPELVRAVVEQLSASERSNWKVILICRTENRSVYSRFQTHYLLHTSIQLLPLGEAESHQLVNSIVGKECDPDWLQRIFKFTRGIPGWICLISEMANDGRLAQIPIAADEIAQTYLNACLNTFAVGESTEALCILRWLALWGKFRMPKEGDRSAELDFLEKQSIPHDKLKQILGLLVQSGIVSNWGIDKRAYAVEPLIVRQQILIKWLLNFADGDYQVSTEGCDLVFKLASGDVPSPDSAFQTLAQLVCVRMGEFESISFVKPLFAVLNAVASDENLLTQFRVVELINKLGAADPEGALEVLIAVRKKRTDDQVIKDSFWGDRTLSHANLLGKVPWLLFELSSHVESESVAVRFLRELQHYVLMEELQGQQFESGKRPRQLVKRLLCESRNFDVFGGSARKIVLTTIENETAWPFSGHLAACLLSPVREHIGWSAKQTMYIKRFVVEPDSKSWQFAADVRNKAFAVISGPKQGPFQGELWKILARAHHEALRVLFHERLSSIAHMAYRNLIKSDLETVLGILSNREADLGMAVATDARNFWEWYLRYGKDRELNELAERCESIYAQINKWRLQDFFAFEKPSDLAGETIRIAESLKIAPTTDDLSAFFDDAMVYLNSAREGKGDLSDNWRIADLAHACSPDFRPFDPQRNILTEYAISILRNECESNVLAKYFAECLCLGLIRNAKVANTEEYRALLEKILSLSPLPDKLFYQLFRGAHPNNNGELLDLEAERAIETKKSVTAEEWHCLLGALFVSNQEKIWKIVRVDLTDTHEIEKRSQLLHIFFRNARLSLLRYKVEPDAQFVDWITQSIIELSLDGSLFGSGSDFDWMREECGYKMNGGVFFRLIQSRLALEREPRSSQSFQILPHEFQVSEWCKVDFDNPAELTSFFELCNLAMEANFTSCFRMPKYLASLDPSGANIAHFVTNSIATQEEDMIERLERLAYLASGFPDTSSEWALIAEAICEQANQSNRDQRLRVYFGLSNKESGVYTSMPGEVPPYFTSRLTKAKEMLSQCSSNSSMMGYWEWAVHRAELDIKIEIASNEEEEHA
jgi:hypothetical protein